MCSETRWTQLNEHLVVHHGAVNVGIVVDGTEALLIDCGGGSVRDTLQALGVARVAAILFTHHHRDQCSGALSLVDEDTWVGAPAAEASLLTDPEQFWTDPNHRWHIYDFRPHTLVVADPVPVHKELTTGDTIRWGPSVIRVLQTPGHTEGSLSYVIQLPDNDGRDYVFCGDLVCGEGQLWDLYSLQKGWQTRDYHGFLGDRERLIRSLRQVQGLRSHILVSSHGEIVDEPDRAIDLACNLLDECYRQYVATSALHHYFPGLFDDVQGHVSVMPPSPHLEVPQYLHHIGTTWLIESRDGPVFMIDCGSPQVVETVRSMQSRGELGPVEQLWISHYHDDHVDGVPDCVQALGCQTIADAYVARVVEQPTAWRLPCISPVRVQFDRQTAHGESWQWHEFALTAYHLPGQTLYHGGLLVEGRGTRILYRSSSRTTLGTYALCGASHVFLQSGRHRQPLNRSIFCHREKGDSRSRSTCRLTCVRGGMWFLSTWPMAIGGWASSERLLLMSSIPMGVSERSTKLSLVLKLLVIQRLQRLHGICFGDRLVLADIGNAGKTQSQT